MKSVCYFQTLENPTEKATNNWKTKGFNILERIPEAEKTNTKLK